MYPKFLIFKLPNVSNKDALSVRKRLLRSPVNKRNKELQHLSKELSLSVNFLSMQISTIDVYILTKSIASYNKKSLQKSLYTQQKKLSSLTRDCNLPIFTTNETITNLTQYQLSQEKSDLLKAGLYFSIQPDKIRKSEYFTTFEKIHRSFLNSFKSEETKSQIKAHSMIETSRLKNVVIFIQTVLSFVLLRKIINLEYLIWNRIHLVIQIHHSMLVQIF